MDPIIKDKKSFKISIQHLVLYFISAAVFLLLAWGIFFIIKPKPEKVYHVGILSGSEFFASTTDGFKEGMAELGYIEKKNIAYDVEKANDAPTYDEAINKFIANKVDLIFVYPTGAFIEAKRLTKESNIQVVFGYVFVEGTGLVDSIAKPGGNITGVRWPGPEVATKRFEIFHEIFPQIKYMIVPYLKSHPMIPSQLAVLEPEASSSGVTIIEVPATGAADLESGLDNSVKGISSYAVLCIPEPLDVIRNTSNIIEKFATDHNAPIGGCSINVSDHKAIFTLGPESFAVGKLASPLADKIFKGISAGNIPVVSSENIFIIDNIAAKNFGINIPQDLLNEATEIIH
jgi:putative ABC transport system substrate-binding protein